MKKVTKIGKPGENATIGKRIEYARTNKGMSQKELAGFLRKSRENISQIENDERGLDIDSLRIIVNILQISSDYLLGLTNFESLDIDNKSINDKLGLSDNAINNIELFNLIEKNNISKKEYSKMYLLNQILASEEFLNDLTASISNGYKEIWLKTMLEKFPNSNRVSLDKAMVEKEFNFSVFNVQNSFVKLFDKMNQRFIDEIGVELVETREDDYV